MKCDKIFLDCVLQGSEVSSGVFFSARAEDFPDEGSGIGAKVIILSTFRDIFQKNPGKCGNFEKTGGGGLPKSHFFCNLTKCFLACQIHSEVLKHVLQ